LPGIFWAGVRNIVVGTATHYGLDISGYEPRLGQDFPYPFTPAQANWASGTDGTGSLSLGTGGGRGGAGVRLPGRGLDHPPSLSTEVEYG